MVNLTEVVPARFVPDMSRAVPAPPEVTLSGLAANVGVTAVAEYVNDVALDKVVVPVVTVSTPVDAPVGTTAIIDVGEIYVVEAANTAPPNLIADVLVNPLPVIVTAVPGPPDTGEKLVISASIINVLVLFALTPRLVTEITPDCPVAGRVAVI